MGTSGSFGGSATKSWQDVAATIEGLGPGSEDAGPDNGSEDPPAEELEPEASPAEQIATAIATALQADDPAIKPRRAPRANPNDSGLSYGQLTGNPRRTGTTKPPPTGGRRQIAASVGRAGRAVGAGYALAAGNAAGLRSYGLDLEGLRSLDKFTQIFKILEAVEIPGSGPDDIALRHAVVEVLDRVLDDTDAPAPLDTLIEMVSSYTNHLLSVELDALTQHGQIDPALIDAHRTELADYIAVRASQLRGNQANLTDPHRFEHAARELLRATLGLLSGDGAL